MADRASETHGRHGDGRRLALVSTNGSPRDASSWSGTPSNLLDGLLGHGVDVEPISSALPRWALRLGAAVNLGRGYAYEPPRSRTTRLAYHTALDRKLKTLGIDSILHTGELDLPLRPDGRRHYLYIDSTLDLYLANPCKPWRRLLPGRREAEKACIDGFRQVDHFFPIADYVRENLIEKYGIPADKITVVGTGRGKISPMTGTKDFSKGHILFVAKGRVMEKGGYLLAEAMKQVRAAGCEVPLVIVGATELAGAVAGMTNVEIKGRIPWEELEALFHGALLYAMPAVHEAWGLVYIEALAARTPILGLRTHAVPEIAGHGAYGFLANAATPSSVASTILDALSDRKRLERMGEAGQAHCLQKYSWENTTGAIARVVMDGQEKFDRRATRDVAQGE